MQRRLQVAVMYDHVRAKYYCTVVYCLLGIAEVSSAVPENNSVLWDTRLKATAVVGVN
jgi:hypothetical protein